MSVNKLINGIGIGIGIVTYLIHKECVMMIIYMDLQITELCHVSQVVSHTLK